VQQRLSSQTAYARREGGPTIHRRLETENLPSKVERAIIIQVEAFDWNCSQYIVPRFSEEEVRGLLEPLKRRIAELESSSLIARKIVPIDRVICASPSYLDRHGIPAHPRELRNHVSLTYGFLLTGNQWKLTGEDGDHWIQPSWSLCANNAEVLCDAAIKGRGVALLPTFIAGAALHDGRLVSFLSTWKAPPLTLYAIYPPTRHLSVKVRLLIDFLVERFSGDPPWNAKVQD